MRWLLQSICKEPLRLEPDREDTAAVVHIVERQGTRLATIRYASGDDPESLFRVADTARARLESWPDRAMTAYRSATDTPLAFALRHPSSRALVALARATGGLAALGAILFSSPSWLWLWTVTAAAWFAWSQRMKRAETIPEPRSPGLRTAPAEPGVWRVWDNEDRPPVSEPRAVLCHLGDTFGGTLAVAFAFRDAEEDTVLLLAAPGTLDVEPDFPALARVAAAESRDVATRKRLRAQAEDVRGEVAALETIRRGLDRDLGRSG